MAISEKNVCIPLAFWNQAANFVNRKCSQFDFDPLWNSDFEERINGVVKWEGIIPTISDTQRFAAVETEFPLSTFDNYSYIDVYDFTRRCNGVFVPTEFLTPDPYTDAYPMNSKPHHGTALILAEQKSSAFENFSLLFDSLNYVVKPHIVSMDEIAELITKAAEKDHRQYDSFICCMSYTCAIDVSKFVEIIQSCDSLQGKPKLFFVASDHVNIPHDIGELDTLVWSCPRSTYTNQFKWFLQRYAHIMDLVSMLGYVSTSVSLFLPLEQIKNCQIKRRCCVIKSQLKSQIVFKEAHDYSALLAQALQDQGHITVKWTKLTFSGPAGTGKSSTLRLLLNEDPITYHHSSPVVIASEVLKVVENEQGEQSWSRVDFESLKEMIAQQMKDSILNSVEDSELDDDYSSLSSLSEAVDYNSAAKIQTGSFENSVAYQISETIPKIQPSSELYKTHWIYAIDSGGQSAFLDVAPALIRYNSANIFTHKLTTKLNDQPEFKFSIRGKCVGKPQVHPITNLQLLEASFHSLSSARAPELKMEMITPPKKPSCFVLGTFFDKLEEKKESLGDKNKVLMSTLKHYEDILVSYRSRTGEVIFPLDAVGDKQQRIINLIRRKICRSFLEAKVPARWFLLQLELMQHRKTNKIDHISFQKCKEIGKSLRMNEDEIKAALIYFHDLTIFLYFANDLPDVIFLHPQTLLNNLSNLLSITFFDVEFLPLKELRQLKETGIFNIQLLRKVPTISRGYSDDFKPKDFLKVMQSLFIIAKLPKEGFYFIPSSLGSIDPEKFKSIKNSQVDPLILTWDMKPLPQGLLPALVVSLLSKKFELLENQYRNAFCLKYKQVSPLLIVDSIYWLEIHFFGHRACCSLIRKAINDGIDSVINKFQYDPFYCKRQEMFFCSCLMPQNNKRDHLCQPNKSKKILTCCYDNRFTVVIDHFHQLPWFDDVTLELDKILEILPKKPEQSDVFRFLLSNADIWPDIGNKLKVEEDILKNLHLEERKTNQEKLEETLKAWLDGKTGTKPTWYTIVNEFRDEQIVSFLSNSEVFQKYKGKANIEDYKLPL